MQMAFSEEQYENAFSLIPARCDPNSNINVDSDEQRAKQSFSRNSTDAGIQIERSEWQP
jgi:hypothetical protein